ncbi:hypothetical protein ABZP36_003410 [Zizania latifolia]
MCAKGKHEDWTALYGLHVLDLRYTEWDEIMSQGNMALMCNLEELNIVGFRCWQHYRRQLQGWLPRLRKLRVLKPTQQITEISTDTDNSLVSKTHLEIIDLSGNNIMEIIPNNISQVSSLLVLVLDGCNGLRNVVMPDGLPPSLRSFSFDSYGPASQWASTVELSQKVIRPCFVLNKGNNKTTKISLKGCTQLDILYLRGLPNLVELDLSGTAIKILDFTTMVVEVPCLKRLFLLGCEQLRGIEWSEEMRPDLELLCVDTRPRIKCPRPSVDEDKSLHVHAIIVDARLARSLCDLIRTKFDDNVSFNIHVTSSPLYSGVVQPKGTFKDKIGQLNNQVNPQQQLVSASQYHDVLSKVVDAPMQCFPRPPTTMLRRHVEIAQGSHNLKSELNTYSHVTLAGLAIYMADSLYVHDVSTNISMPARDLQCLRLCRIEMCPMLETVFPGEFYSFNSLQHMHLRCCPRLQFILPVGSYSFPNLETLHIIHCSDLRNIFVLGTQYTNEITVDGVNFPKLATIHLHDLPMLRQICEFKMVTPELKTIKIRGCWSLRRLPAIVALPAHTPKPAIIALPTHALKPAIEIEKDVWDKLEWDGVEAGHHPSLYEKPQSSCYYRKKMPMVSILRCSQLVVCVGCDGGFSFALPHGRVGQRVSRNNKRPGLCMVA